MLNVVIVCAALLSGLGCEGQRKYIGNTPSRNVGGYPPAYFNRPVGFQPQLWSQSPPGFRVQGTRLAGTEAYRQHAPNGHQRPASFYPDRLAGGGLPSPGIRLHSVNLAPGNTPPRFVSPVSSYHPAAPLSSRNTSRQSLASNSERIVRPRKVSPPPVPGTVIEKGQSVRQHFGEKTVAPLKSPKTPGPIESAKVSDVAIPEPPKETVNGSGQGIDAAVSSKDEGLDEFPVDDDNDDGKKTTDPPTTTTNHGSDMIELPTGEIVPAHTIKKTIVGGTIVLSRISNASGDIAKPHRMKSSRPEPATKSGVLESTLGPGHMQPEYEKFLRWLRNNRLENVPQPAIASAGAGVRKARPGNEPVKHVLGSKKGPNTDNSASPASGIAEGSVTQDAPDVLESNKAEELKKGDNATTASEIVGEEGSEPQPSAEETPHRDEDVIDVDHEEQLEDDTGPPDAQGSPRPSSANPATEATTTQSVTPALASRKPEVSSTSNQRLPSRVPAFRRILRNRMKSGNTVKGIRFIPKLRRKKTDETTLSPSTSNVMTTTMRPSPLKTRYESVTEAPSTEKTRPLPTPRSPVYVLLNRRKHLYKNFLNKLANKTKKSQHNTDSVPSTERVLAMTDAPPRSTTEDSRKQNEQEPTTTQVATPLNATKSVDVTKPVDTQKPMVKFIKMKLGNTSTRGKPSKTKVVLLSPTENRGQSKPLGGTRTRKPIVRFKPFPAINKPPFELHKPLVQDEINPATTRQNGSAKSDSSEYGKEASTLPPSNGLTRPTESGVFPGDDQASPLLVIDQDLKPSHARSSVLRQEQSVDITVEKGTATSDLSTASQSATTRTSIRPPTELTSTTLLEVTEAPRTSPKSHTSAATKTTSLTTTMAANTQMTSRSPMPTRTSTVSKKPMTTSTPRDPLTTDRKERMEAMNGDGGFEVEAIVTEIEPPATDHRDGSLDENFFDRYYKSGWVSTDVKTLALGGKEREKPIIIPDFLRYAVPMARPAPDVLRKKMDIIVDGYARAHYNV